MAELFRAQELGYKFSDGVQGLVRVDLDIEEGEFIVLAGRNGSGKTLLARHLAGLSFPSQGSIKFRGQDTRNSLKNLRKSIGYVFQDSDSQIIGQTIAEDVAFGPANLGLKAAEIADRVAQALIWARLEGREAQRPETLSGGERRRLAIAGVLAMKPDCLILDEPFANLDLESVLEISDICKTLHSKGITLIVLTHELEKIIHAASRLILLDSGSIRYDGAALGAPPELFAMHGLACPYKDYFPWALPMPPQGEEATH